VEVATLAAELAALEQEHLCSSILFQKLSRYFSFGAAGKLDWARFKLRFKQEELDHLMIQLEKLKAAAPPVDPTPDPRSAPPTGHAGETGREKMERMIADNPPLLAPHIRRAYRPLIEAEQQRTND
jgi:hypothetical protein